MMYGVCRRGREGGRGDGIGKGKGGGRGRSRPEFGNAGSGSGQEADSFIRNRSQRREFWRSGVEGSGLPNAERKRLVSSWTRPESS